MVTNGRSVAAAEALDLGLVDAIVDGDLRQQAGQLAKRLVGATLRRTGELKIAAFAKPALSAALAAVAKTARGAAAPTSRCADRQSRIAQPLERAGARL
jgi:3-hydroxyacyl-CoA dehydrogenase